MDKIKPCPFCGTKVELSKRPLWQGNHGYYNCFEFEIVCPKCGCNVMYGRNDTIYRTEEEAIQNAIKAWNKRDESNNTVILDKVKAEIIELRSKQNVGVLECLDIIDKYKGEKVKINMADNIFENLTDEEKSYLWMYMIFNRDKIIEKTEQWTKEAEKRGMTLTEYLESINPLDKNKEELPIWLGKNCKDCGNEKCKKLGTLPKGYSCALWQPGSEDKG